MLCALLVSKSAEIVKEFQLLALDFDCILKAAETKEDYYSFAPDTPFSAMFLDCGTFDECEIFDLAAELSQHFIRSKLYLYVDSNTADYGKLALPIIKGKNGINDFFKKEFSKYFGLSNMLLSSLRCCDAGNFSDYFVERRLLAVFPNTSVQINEKLLSVFPIELLPEKTDVFTDGTAVFALIDAPLSALNRISYRIIIELHNLNISAFSIYTDIIESHSAASRLYAEINAYAVKMRIENNNTDVLYYNNEMFALEPFGNIIKKAQATGVKIRSNISDAKLEHLIESFFGQPQLSDASLVNMQFLVCEILRTAFSNEILYNNLFAVISCSDINELKRNLITICTKEKIGQRDLDVSANERIIRQICDIIESQYASELYLDRVAEQIYLSPAYISRIFKKSTGMNFVKYLNEVRLKKAAALLIESDYSINEISKRVGFSDVSYFCSCFKVKYGMTTVQYRRAYVLKEIEG